MYKLFILIMLCIFLTGCSSMDMPTPKQIVTHPIGTIPLKTGMTKSQVIEMWGKPDVVTPLASQSKAGYVEEKEEWIYHGRYSKSPFDAGYFSKTKRLYFDGQNLTRWTQEED